MPEVSRSSKGKSIANLVNMAEGEKIAALLRVQAFPEEEGERFIVMGTRKGTIKKTDLDAFSNPRAAGIIAIQIDDDDRLIAVAETDGTKDLVIGTRNGMAIRFAEEDARPMGRSAYGVRGIQLREGDEVVAMKVVSDGATLLTVCERGFGKRTDLSEYRRQSRGGIGLKNVQTSDRNGLVVGIACVADRDQLLHRHRAGPDHPHDGRRPAPDRPRHAGRAADRSGRRRPRRVDCGADGAGGTRSPRARRRRNSDEVLD